MKTLLRFWIFEEGEIRLSNLGFAFLVTFISIMVISILSYGATWFVGVDFSKAEITVFHELVYRVLIGSTLLGMFNGLFFIIGLFVLAMKFPRSEGS